MTAGRAAPRGALAVVVLTVLVDMVGFGIIIPFLPFWAERFGAAPDLVTLLVSTFSATQFLCAFVWGWVSDRWGRKPVLLISLAGSVLSFAWLAFADSLWMLFAARAVAGAMGASGGVAQAYVADITPGEGRARGMALLGAAFGIGFILGPALGGVLAGGDPQNPDFRTPFLAGAAVSFVAFVLGIVFLREPARRAEPAVPDGIRGQLRAFASLMALPGVARPVIIATILAFVMGGVQATFALWTERQFDWGPRENGYIFAYIGALLVGVQAGLVGRLTRRFGETPLVVAAILTTMIGIGAFPLATDLGTLLVVAGLFSIGIGIANPTLSSLTSRAAPAERQGAVLGAAQSCQSLARVVGPAIAGVLFAAISHHAPYVAGAVILAAVLVLALRMNARTS